MYRVVLPVDRGAVRRRSARQPEASAHSRAPGDATSPRRRGATVLAAIGTRAAADTAPHPAAPPPVTQVRRRAALRQHELGQGERVLQRRHHRRPDHGAVEGVGPARRGAHLVVRLQGQERGHPAPSARSCNVGAVLEGSVAKAGNQVRITAQLINTADGYHLWSDSYDRELQDIFAVRSQVAQTVAQALQVTLGRRRAPDARAEADGGPGGVSALFEGAPCGRDASPTGEHAVRYLQQAVARDPNTLCAAVSISGWPEYWAGNRAG